jgi:hypothetical protein
MYTSALVLVFSFNLAPPICPLSSCLDEWLDTDPIATARAHRYRAPSLSMACLAYLSLLQENNLKNRKKAYEIARSEAALTRTMQAEPELAITGGEGEHACAGAVLVRSSLIASEIKGGSGGAKLNEKTSIRKNSCFLGDLCGSRSPPAMVSHT